MACSTANRSCASLIHERAATLASLTKVDESNLSWYHSHKKHQTYPLRAASSSIEPLILPRSSKYSARAKMASGSSPSTQPLIPPPPCRQRQERLVNHDSTSKYGCACETYRTGDVIVATALAKSSHHSPPPSGIKASRRPTLRISLKLAFNCWIKAHISIEQRRFSGPIYDARVPLEWVPRHA